MRNLKKFLALVLAMLMVVSAGATVSAYSDVADEDAYAAAIAALTEWGIVNGTELGEAEDGSDALYEPDADVTRWQMALMMARTLAPEVEEEDWAEGMEIFGDVTEWYGAIAYAYVEGIINGVSTEELVFKPNDGIKYQDGLIMALRALGYEVDCSGVVYWLDAWTQAKQIGLTDGIAITSGAKTMTRAEMAQLIYNMINLPFADGSESLAIKYYGEEAPIGDATTFVITATPGQAYVKGQHTDATKADGETAATLLGLQKLEAGIPAGDIIYFEAEALGIDAAKANDYLHYAVNLYDYDAEYNDFSAYEIVADPVVVRSNKLAADGSTIKVGGYTYYPVASLTEAARRNEIVVFTGDADKKDSLVLLKNKDGNIVDFNGVIKASYVYTLGATNYYVYQPVEGNPTVISETRALELFGVKTADDAVFTEYQTKTAAELKVHKDGAPNEKAYQLSLFDDNGDGKYDRAIYEDVYMSVYNEVDSNSNQKATGTVENAPYHGKNVSFSDSSVKSKGKVFTYTYNPQLKKVNVLEVLAAKTGTVTNVNIKDQKVTIDGTTYTLGTPNREYLMGANLIYTDGKAYDDIAKGAIDYADLTVFYNIGSSYNFYEYNGYLIAGKKINPVDEDANWKYFVSAGAVAYDSTAVYVDGYVGNGEKTTIEISVIDADVNHPNVTKDTALADMNIFDLGEFLADAKDLFAKGNLFRIVPREDGTYRLLSNKATREAQLINGNTFDLNDVDGRIVFTDGISAAADKADRIRTDAETVFYFVKYDTTDGTIDDLDIVVGEPDDGDYIASSAKVYADLVGWGRSKVTTTYGVERANSGVANVVMVYYTALSEIGGFNITTGIDDYSIVYVTAVENKNVGLTIVPASEVDDSARSWYYKMADSNAIDMETGAVISTVYATAIIENAGFYKMDAHNVISALETDPLKNADEAAVAAQLVAKKVTAIDFDDQYVTLELNNVDVITLGNKITTVYHTDTKTGDIAKYTNNSKDDHKIVVGDYVAMLNLDSDKVQVIVEVAAPVVPSYDCACGCDDCDCKVATSGAKACPAAKCGCKCCVGVVGNAKFYENNVERTDLKAIVTGADDGILSGIEIKVYNAAGQIKMQEYVNKDMTATNIAIYKDSLANNVMSGAYTVKSDIAADGTVKLDITKLISAVTLDAGDYQLLIEFNDNDNNQRKITYNFVIAD